MTVRVERSFEVPAPRERVWDLISDPGYRAGAISVVQDYEIRADGNATWQVSLPIPVINRTIAVTTTEKEVRPPEYVRFVGRSKVMNVIGEHELTETPDGTRVTNRFVVDGDIPGVERYFERNFDAEIGNLKTSLLEELEVEV